MFIKQLSIFVENRKGGLAEILSELGEKGIDICALALADTTDFGILRLIVNDSARAEEILREHGVAVKINNVLGIAVDDRPGGLSAALAVLNQAGLAIEYMYAFVGDNDRHAMVVLRTDDDQKALQALASEGVSILSEADLGK